VLRDVHSGVFERAVQQAPDDGRHTVALARRSHLKLLAKIRLDAETQD